LLLLAPADAAHELSMRIEDLDENRDGIVDKQEFMLAARDMLHQGGSGVEKRARTSIYKYAERLYETCDLNGDEVMNAREVEYCGYLSEMAAANTKQWTNHELPRFLDEYDFEGGAAEMKMRSFDMSGDGFIDSDEYWAVVQSDLVYWGIVGPDDPWPPWVERIFAKADITEDGRLGAREMQYASALMTHALIAEMGVILLRELDLDGDGRVAEWEVKKAESLMDPTKFNSVLESFPIADRDRDGGLCNAELKILTALVMRRAYENAQREIA